MQMDKFQVGLAIFPTFFENAYKEYTSKKSQEQIDKEMELAEY